MPNLLKISLFLLVLALVGLGAVVALQLRQMPPAANVDFIQIAIAEELEEMRAIARDSQDVDLGFDFGPLKLTNDDGSLRADHEAASNEHLATIDPLDDRVEAIDNPLIVLVSLQHRVHSEINNLSYQINSGEFVGGGSPFTHEPTLGSPVVSRMIGARRNVVRYAELVVKTDDLEIGFELYLDMGLLMERYAESTAE
ncbi:MAG: hypothetical protein GY902_12000 [Planctomycetes bacterium]|nr:hypothetical protein [Planctomycetota bacterium]